MARNRIIYASQSVWCNGEVLYRVQSLGSTTTFTSEDIFELGHLDIVDVVDDVPAVAVTLNTNDFGDVRTLALLAQVAPAKRAMDATATNDNANLVVVSGTQLAETSTYLHGVALSDFAITCGNLTGVTLWAPVQEECSLGTLANNIDQTLFLDEVYINSLEFGYTTGANATENYGAETDMKMWLLNSGRFVNYEEFTLASGTTSVTLSGVASDGRTVATLTGPVMGFLRKAPNGAPGVTVFDASANSMANYEVAAAAGLDIFGYSAGVLTLPTSGYAPDAGDKLFVIYAANGYAASVDQKYMEIMDDKNRPDNVGALRQGQVEIYIVDPQTTSTWDLALRLTSCTITADLTREPLLELGHLGPYDRPLTLPIPITATVEATAGDLENWAKVAGKLAEFDAKTLTDLTLADLFGKEDLVLVVKVYAQTDEEARGTGAYRTIGSDSKMINYFGFNNGAKQAAYAAGNREYALKTIVVEHLKITDEGMTLDMGANATQTFGFRSTNDLYVIKGDLDVTHVTGAFKIRRNG